MSNPADTLRAIEARAEDAIREQLRLMTHEILALRARLTLEHRVHADILHLELDPLDGEQVSAPAGESDPPALPLPTLSLTVFESQLPKAYRVLFYEHDYGDLADVVTVDTFETGVQLVRDRLSPDGDYEISAAWSKHQGEMTVATTHGTVLARIDADDGAAPTVQPDVRDACGALRAGDASRIERLFGRMLEAA